MEERLRRICRTDNEKCLLKDKLAREILRLRGENQTLAGKMEGSRAPDWSQADYEAVHNAVSEVQYKIAEYVNAINKTQQSLADTYQGMNSIKKKLAAKMTGEKEEQNKKAELWHERQRRPSCGSSVFS